MNFFSDQEDPVVVAAAQKGDRSALREVFERHRPWVYNISLKMMGHPGVAEDATQEIFIKVIRRIDSFEGRSTFRTWLYRVAFHHLLNAKRSHTEEHISSFDEYGARLQAAPDMELDNIPLPERELLIQEGMTACMTGMLLCLSREQRLAYVLGAIFELPDVLASEILEIQPATFRKRLQRARDDLHNFMNGNCGLINKDNPCRCSRKTKRFMEAGFVDRDRLGFQRDRLSSIREKAPRDSNVVYEKLTNDYPALYRKHPFSDPQDLAQRISSLLEDTALQDLLPP